MPPDSSGHWQRPRSRVQTCRFTVAVRAGDFADGLFCRGFFTRPFRLGWRCKTRSSPASRMASALAAGRAWESAARAASSLSRNRLDTVTWSRESSPVSGSAESRWTGFASGEAGATSVLVHALTSTAVDEETLGATSVDPQPRENARHERHHHRRLSKAWHRELRMVSPDPPTIAKRLAPQAD